VNRDEIALYVGRKVRITAVREGILKQYPGGDLHLRAEGLNNPSETFSVRVPVYPGFVTAVEPVMPLGWPPQRGDVWKNVKSDVSYIAGPSPSPGTWVLVPDDLDAADPIRGEAEGAYALRDHETVAALSLMYRRN
jgi:hypothetical protein